MTEPLKNLAISTLYLTFDTTPTRGRLTIDGIAAMARPLTGKRKPTKLEASEELLGLADSILTDSRNEFGLLHDGQIYRVTRILNAGSPHLKTFALRRAVGALQPLKGMFSADYLARYQNQAEAIRRLEELHQLPGLTLFVGPPGTGKTTTAASTVGTWCSNVGGVGLMLTYPHELNIPMTWGAQGLFYQEEVPGDTEEAWDAYIAKALRPEVDFLLINEVRHPAVAHKLVLAAETGMRVVSTSHGDTAAQAIQRIVTFLEQRLGADAGRILSSILRVVVHCDMSKGAPPVLRLHDVRAREDIRSLISTGDWNGLDHSLGR